MEKCGLANNGSQGALMENVTKCSGGQGCIKGPGAKVSSASMACFSFTDKGVARSDREPDGRGALGDWAVENHGGGT